MSSGQQNIDFKSAVTALADEVQTAMVSLYSLQTALINATNIDRTRQFFTPMRNILHEQWDDLLRCLKKCHAFGADISMLQYALKTKRTDNRMEFLDDMDASVKELQTLFERLRVQSCQNTVIFSTERDRLERILKHPKSIKRAKLKAAKSLYDRDQQAFVETYLAAVYPDGGKALSDTEHALVQITANLTTICQFWESTRKRYLAESTDGRLSITPMQAAQIVTSWKGYQQGIEEAIMSIAKTNDAILVQAVGAPPLPPGFFRRMMKKGGRLVGRTLELPLVFFGQTMKKTWRFLSRKLGLPPGVIERIVQMAWRLVGHKLVLLLMFSRRTMKKGRSLVGHKSRGGPMFC